MKTLSNHLGQFEYEDTEIISVAEGLLGFEHLTEFILVNFEETLPFKWLVSIEEPMIAFPLINPSLVEQNYSIELNKENVDAKLLLHPESNLVYSIVNFSDHKPTLNLRGPVIINEKEKFGMQLVLNDDKYAFRHPLNVPQPETEKE